MTNKDKDARLAAALRENLRKRKAGAASVKTPPPAPPAEGDEDLIVPR